MEHIRQAVERARDSQAANAGQGMAPGADWPAPIPNQALHAPALDTPSREVELNSAHLEEFRVVAHDPTDPRSKSFDMLRTQVLQSMDLKEWQLVAVTSPTPGCGKTLTAVNLALSIARQSEREVLLVDMDIRKPRVATTLGFRAELGLISTLEGRSSLHDAMTAACVGKSRLAVLPCETHAAAHSEWMSSQAMTSLLAEIKRQSKSRIVIVDLPPILVSDDVISVLPQIDCVLFVAAVGTSTLTEVKECNKHLQSTSVVRIVLNKVTEPGTAYYYYY
jgi:Mrp family chromosome partitioning ATPase